ncbi:hypothetical protein AB4212_10715, partial [Streptomyces sp. 2MCAF27]
GLDFTIVYFGSLTDRPASPAWSAHPGIKTPSPLPISRADLAQCLLDAVESPSPTADRLSVSGAPKG